jgi:hypothetical protein
LGICIIFAAAVPKVNGVGVMKFPKFRLAVVLSVVLLGFQLPALASDVQRSRELVKEAAALTQQAADLAEADEKRAKESGDLDSIDYDSTVKANDLINQAGKKIDEARAIILAGPLTEDQKKGLVPGYGDRDGDGDNDPSHPSNLAEQTQNPVASLISVPLESNFNFDVGPEGNTQYVMNVKPVIPQNINEDWNWIHRGIQPIIVQDNLTDTDMGLETDSSIFGMGDLTYQGFLTPKKAEKVIWGVGGVLVVPWGEDGLTSDKWQAGPGFVALTKINSWVIGSVVTQQWDFAGRGSAEDVSLAVWQYFVNYNLKDGWFLTSSPTMTANWEADKTGDRLTIPYGGGFGKIFKIDGHPFRWSTQVFGYAASPDSVDTSWTLQAEFRLLFP